MVASSLLAVAASSAEGRRDHDRVLTLDDPPIVGAHQGPERRQRFVRVGELVHGDGGRLRVDRNERCRERAAVGVRVAGNRESSRRGSSRRTNGLSCSPATTSAMSAGSGFQFDGVATTMPRGSEGASSAMSDSPAREPLRPARRREPVAAEQLGDEVVARDRGGRRDRRCRARTGARGREHVGHWLHGLLAHDDALRETRRGRGSVRFASTGSSRTVPGLGTTPSTDCTVSAPRRRSRWNSLSRPAAPE